MSNVVFDDFKNIWKSVYESEATNAGFITGKSIKEAQEKAKAEIEEQERKARELDKVLGVELKKLSFKEGEVLLVKLLTAPKPGLNELVSQLRKLPIIVKNRVQIFIVPHDLALETIDEKQMNEAGWFKRGDARRLLRPYE